MRNYSDDLRLHGVLITTLSVLRAMFHVDLSGTHWVTLWSFTLMVGAWFSSTFGSKPKESLFFSTMSMSALPHMANPSAVGLGRERPISGSDFFQSWPKWKHLVLIRDSGCDSCSGSCEDLAVVSNADCGTRTKYTNISTVIMCQVKQAIEGLGCLCLEGALSERARCVTWMQGIEWDPQQDKLGHQTLMGFRIFFWLRQMQQTTL